jgi:hypothetical protein
MNSYEDFEIPGCVVLKYINIEEFDIVTSEIINDRTNRYKGTDNNIIIIDDFNNA